MTEKIIDMFKSAEIGITERQAEQFRTLYEFMVEYNEKVNLTSITGFEDVVMKHFIDSVLPFTMLELPLDAEFIDVGTGAGFPSLPLLIMFPSLKGTLCDSLGKRCTYLEQACAKINVAAKIIHARGEELGRKRREQYDFATARAVAALPVLTELCLPFVKVGGSFIALKSVNEDVSAAQNAIRQLGGKLEKTLDYKLPNGDDRRLVVVKKISQTPTKFPRAYANITKKPL
ncbi:MAG: 16S rRNA (guanine(527)-N(7))-methyltransferase RsmG [Lachnospiraceae bacterium]|nr:16S rRNA (guanine(527)-N(7))-methyltransferase RsmG [Ruminococcus sp.]MCM1274780.1 16S rRNA (guanine(527)-N(7))-methyltransferase RsmG [Lachnospiraceae bacterium]